MLTQHLEGEIDPLQVASGNRQVASGRGAGADSIGVKALRQIVDVNRHAHLKQNTFGLEHLHAAVNHTLVELKVRNTITQKTSRVGLAVKDSYLVPFGIEANGGAQPGRACADDGYPLTVAFGFAGLDEPFAESGFSNSRFVFADGYRLFA